MIMDGKAVAEQIQHEIKLTIEKSKGRKPCLAMILVGAFPSSKIYVNRKNKSCAAVGITSITKEFSSEISEEQLLQEIEILNHNPDVDGILVQLPLPKQISAKKVIYAINPEKDVDGFHPLNVGKLLIGETDGFFPCTPLGIQVLLEYYSVSVAGQNVLVIGRSNIVGKPIAALLMQNSSNGNATVTVANRSSKHLKDLCLRADIIIAAIGQPRFITLDMISEGAIVIDVGINQVVNKNHKTGYQIVGDVDFENIKDKCAFITPVPGGIGPMTIAMLLQNTLKSYKNRFQ
jgi:methylenetetrahydrofolate dehydrogenase (NADP+) / methenyltetrahydrofolate cyclohydrolase